jgi:hypothetical protein
MTTYERALSKSPVRFMKTPDARGNLAHLYLSLGMRQVRGSQCQFGVYIVRRMILTGAWICGSVLLESLVHVGGLGQYVLEECKGLVTKYIT